MTKAAAQTLFDACLDATNGHEEAALQLFLVIHGVRHGVVIFYDLEPATASFAGLRLDRDTRERLAHLNATEDPFPRLALFAEAHGLRAVRRDPGSVFIQRADKSTKALRACLRLPGDFVSFTPADYELFTAVGAFLDLPRMTAAEFESFTTGHAYGRGVFTVREVRAGPHRLTWFFYATARGDRTASKRKEWGAVLKGLRLPGGECIDRIDVIDRAY